MAEDAPPPDEEVTRADAERAAAESAAAEEAARARRVWLAFVAGFDPAITEVIDAPVQRRLAAVGVATVLAGLLGGLAAGALFWTALDLRLVAVLVAPIGAAFVVNIHRMLVAGVGPIWERAGEGPLWEGAPHPLVVLLVLGFVWVQPLLAGALGGSAEDARAGLVDLRTREVLGERLQRLERLERLARQADQGAEDPAASRALTDQAEAARLEDRRADERADQDLARYTAHLAASPLFGVRWARAWRWPVACVPAAIALCVLFCAPQIALRLFRGGVDRYVAERHARERAGIVAAWEDAWGAARAMILAQHGAYSRFVWVHEPPHLDLPFGTVPRAQTLRPRPGDPRLAERRDPKELLPDIPEHGAKPKTKNAKVPRVKKGAPPQTLP